MFKALTLWRQQRRAIRELSELTDRELADVGIVRGEIESLVRTAPGMAQGAIEAPVRLGRGEPERGAARVAAPAPVFVRDLAA